MWYLMEVMSASRMTPRQRIEALLNGRPVDRTPFCPAVYEHKAALVGVSPSELSRDADLFERAMVREAEIYEPDILTVGCDVYNVEAEAVGCRVSYPDSNDVPAVTGRVIWPGGDISRLRIPDPLKDGRMPLLLEVGRRIQARFGRERIVRGALSAPFSIASELVGPTELLFAIQDNEAWVRNLLAFCVEVVKTFGRAFAGLGLGVVLFDSYASPPMTSPEIYRTMILPPTGDVVRHFRRDLGISLVPYIMGGDTGILLEEILKTGTNNVLCDFKADLKFFVARLRDEPVLLRANLSPAFLTVSTVPAIKEKTREILAVGRQMPRFLMGTGILPYDLPPEKVIAVRDALEEAAFSA